MKVYEDKDAKKKLTGTNAKALTALRQKMRKQDQALEIQIEKYRAVSSLT